MPIVNQKVTGNSLQVSGKRRVSYEYTDHVGGVHSLQSLTVEGDADINADMLARIPAIEDGLDESEMQSFNGDPLTATFNHTTKKKVIRRMLIEAMKDENPKVILKLKPVIDWIRANYTGVQIANYLNITIQQAQKLATRFDALVLIASTLNTDSVEVIE